MFTFSRPEYAQNAESLEVSKLSVILIKDGQMIFWITITHN
jgi:hypothetical protein